MPLPRRNADPPSVLARLDRLPGQRVRTGLLSIEDATALAAAGFEPVSEVIGAVVGRDTPGGFYSAGNLDPATGQGRTYTSTAASVAVGTPPSLLALKGRYATMLKRLVNEARAIGADGVVGIKIERTEESMDGATLRTFVATGTAIRAVGRVHTDLPFTTDLTGAQVGSALRSGWVPLSLLIVACMAIRRIEPFSQVWGDNSEMYAYTDLITTARSQVRKDFTAEAARIGADSAVLSEMTLQFEPAPIQNASTVLVSMTGTALADCGRRFEQPAPLAIMPLRAAQRSEHEHA